MLKKVTLAIALSALCTMQLNAPVVAQSSGRDVVQDLVTLFSAWSNGRGRHTIYDEASHHIDFPTMTEMAFTPAQWDAFTTVQKRDLIASFRTLVENRYYKRWHKLFLRSRLTVANEARAGGDIYVKTYVTEGRTEDTVIWRLHPHSGEPMVVSLNVNGKDLVNRLSERFQKQLKKRGAPGLVAWMKNQAIDDEDDNDSGNIAQRRYASK
jgi:ABC-type transporter MlaC component